METCYNLALELEMLIRNAKGYLHNPAANFSANFLEAGAFVEVLAFYLQDLSGGKYRLDAYFPDVEENMGKCMDDIGYARCKEYLEQAQRLLNL
ncbi:MAG: hypothetical protein IJE07_06720 [Clostridia bacterium]|nr:hypothetical protein [Clostridia bacterium]